MSDRKLTTQVLRFGGIGVLGAGTNLLIYWLSLRAGVHYIVGSVGGWFTGLVLVFFLNRWLTFKSSGSLIADFSRTFGVYVLQQVIVVCGLALGVEVFHLDPLLSYCLVVPIAVAWSFLGLKLYAMRSQ